MADFTLYPNGEPIGRAGGANAASYPAVTVFENSYDSGYATVTNGDVCTEFLLIPAGSYVLGVMVDVQGTEAAVTLDVGDATDPNGYVAAADLSVAGRVAGAGAYLNNVGAMPTPQFYAADTWLQFTVAGADATVAKFRVAVVVANAG